MFPYTTGGFPPAAKNSFADSQSYTFLLHTEVEQASHPDAQPRDCCTRTHLCVLTPRRDDAQVYRNDADEKGAEKPAMAHPGDFHLVFRENGRSPVTMWEPVAPEGYAALGTLVEGSPQMPDPAEVLCVREDLTRRTGYFDSAIWRWDPPGLQASLLGCPAINFHNRSLYRASPTLRNGPAGQPLCEPSHSLLHLPRLSIPRLRGVVGW